MKIERLTIHNIASIADAEIDFTASPLCDSGVFLIAGDTGAGKSTILDCICLALYSNTPRLRNCRMTGRQRDVDRSELSVNTPSQLLRRGTGEGFAALVFSGNDGVRYEAIWSVQRARKRPSGRLQPREWVIRDFATGDVLYRKGKEISEFVIRVTDLDFDQFCRTCMLAQGDFDRFLNSGDDEKSAILEKILGDRTYTLVGKALYDMTEIRKKAYEELRAQSASIVVMSDEQRMAVEAESAGLRARGERLEKERAVCGERLQWLTRRQQLKRDSETAAKNLAAAREAVDDKSFREECRLMDDWRQAERLRHFIAMQRHADVQLMEVTAREESLRRAYADVLYRKSDTDYRLRELEARRETIFDADVLTEAYHEFARTAGETFGVMPVIDFHGIPDIASSESDHLFSLEEWMSSIEAADYSRQLNAINTRITLADRLADAVTALSVARKVRKENEDAVAGMRAAVVGLMAKLEVSQAVSAEKDKALQTAQEIYDRQKASIDDWARSVRRSLRQGDTCPVCHQVISAAIPAEEDFEKMIQPLADALIQSRMSAEKERMVMLSLKASLETEKQNLTRAEKQLATDRSVDECARKVDSLSRECAAFIAGDVEDISDVKGRLAAEKNRLETVVAHVSRLRRALNDLRADFNRRQKETSRLTEELMSEKKKGEDMSAGIRRILARRALWTEVERCADATAHDHNALLSDIIAADSASAAARTQIAEADKGISAEKQAHPSWDDRHISMLAAITANDADGRQRKINKVNETLTRAEEAMRIVRTALTEYEAKRPQMKETEDNADATASRLEALSSEITSNAETLGSLTARIEADIEAHKKIDSLRKQTEDARKEYLKWETLGARLGSADGKLFRRIALSYVLESLIRAANAYMHRLFPRYTLSIDPGTYTMYVCDSYNDNTPRPTAGISGGETFIVSLALALALADIGGRLAVNILFIDEGFGSLSGEPLHNAIETLRLLGRRAGRQVGIISHVEELRERLPVQIRVLPTGPAGAGAVRITTAADR